MRTLKEENFSLLLNFIEDYGNAHSGVSPSIYDIAEGTGIPKTTVTRYLSAMEERGMLRRESRRGLVLSDSEEKGVRVPLLGSIACGIPKLAEENIESYVRLPAALFGKGPFFMLRAWGNSMINAGIEDGDLVLIRQQSTARPGQIVVALTGDEATLKRYYPEPLQHRIRLQPENDGMEPIYVRDCIIQGVAVRVMKELD